MPDTIVAREHLDALNWRCIGPFRGRPRCRRRGRSRGSACTFYFGALRRRHLEDHRWRHLLALRFRRLPRQRRDRRDRRGPLRSQRHLRRHRRDRRSASTSPTATASTRSTDAGRTWSNVGLRETQAHRPDLRSSDKSRHRLCRRTRRRVRSERGARRLPIVRRRQEPGRSPLPQRRRRRSRSRRWIRNNPRILFAAIWEARRSFWNICSGGPGSGLFRSTDGGDTWEDISRAAGPARRPAGQARRRGLARQGRPRLGADRGDRTTRPASIARTITAHAGAWSRPTGT